MAWSSAAWVLGGVRLISSARRMLAKIGPWTKRRVAPAGRRVFLEDVGAGDVGGHQVGRELDALEVEVERLGQGRDHERLGEARHAEEQGVAAAEERHEHQLDDPALADDAPRDLILNFLTRFGELGGLISDVGGFHVQGGKFSRVSQRAAWAGPRG